MSKFDKILKEMMAGMGGVFGDFGGEEHGGDVGNTDWYATGDTRLPKALGAKNKKTGKKKKGIPVFRRTLPPM